MDKNIKDWETDICIKKLTVDDVMPNISQDGKYVIHAQRMSVEELKEIFRVEDE